jgi:hypothetical protein
MKWLGILIALEAALMAVVAGLVLQSERHTRFPKSVPVVQVQPGAAGTIPVTYSVSGAAGRTATTQLSTRGGAAATASDTGYVGYRREAGPK